MKKYFILMVSIVPLCIHAERFAIDRIEVVIHNDRASRILTKTEIELPGLDGKAKTAKEKIVERLVEDEAERFGLAPTPESIEENWEKIKKQHNMSERDMHNLVKGAGYTIDEAKEELGRMSSSSQILGFKVHAQAFVSKRDVLNYYETHPEYRQAEYFIARAVVPFSEAASRQELCNKLQTYRTTGNGLRIAWSEPFWLLEDEVAADKKFICSMEPGAISDPITTYNGFELIKLIDKHPAMLVPLQERYNQIEYQLKMPKFQQELDRYTNELMSKATIVYL
jgi:hypothetical protein